MTTPKLSKLELKVMDMMWAIGPASIREIQEQFPEKSRPAYTTVQTIISRLEAKGAVRREKKIGNAHIFAATTTQKAEQRRYIDDLLNMFGGRPQMLISHLVESGQLSMKDIDEARELLRELDKKE
jgi:predicted transcriptional regulator